MTDHKTGTREEWLAARLELLEAEKALTRRGDELAQRRQKLPWVRVDKNYRFETDEGSASLAGLFRGRSQLLVYHFMFGPDYTAGCPSCSAIADGFNGCAVQLASHDVTLSAVSRAPLAKLQAYKQRMGWTFPWASSAGSDFNFDFNVQITEEQQREGGVEYNYRREAQLTLRGDVGPVAEIAAMTGTDVATYTRERPGISAFALEDGVVYHTYSAYARGVDGLWGMYQWLDRAPQGRNETGVGGRGGAAPQDRPPGPRGALPGPPPAGDAEGGRARRHAAGSQRRHALGRREATGDNRPRAAARSASAAAGRADVRAGPAQRQAGGGDDLPSAGQPRPQHRGRDPRARARAPSGWRAPLSGEGPRAGVRARGCQGRHGRAAPGFPLRHPSMTTSGFGIMDLAWWQLGLALLLVAVVAIISLRQALGLERDLLVGTVRTIAQLYLVGLILDAVFAAARWYWVLLILVAMAAIATHAAVSRLAKPIPGVYWIAAAALSISTAATLTYVIGVVVQPRPWWEPQYLIPIAGMILGNSMTSAALAGHRPPAERLARRDEVEARLALGFSGREAVPPLVRAALRHAMIPTVNGRS